MQPIGIGLSVEFHHTFPFPFSPLLLFCFSSRSCNHQTFKKHWSRALQVALHLPCFAPLSHSLPLRTSIALLLFNLNKKRKLSIAEKTKASLRKNRQILYACVSVFVCMHVCVCASLCESEFVLRFVYCLSCLAVRWLHKIQKALHLAGNRNCSSNPRRPGSSSRCSTCHYLLAKRIPFLPR